MPDVFENQQVRLGSKAHLQNVLCVHATIDMSKTIAISLKNCTFIGCNFIATPAFRPGFVSHCVFYDCKLNGGHLSFGTFGNDFSHCYVGDSVG